MGKTWAVEAFAQSHFKSLVKVDLEKRADLHPAFDGNIDGKAVLSRPTLATGAPITPDETLPFSDEIQACPLALMALRYLYEDVPDLHVIAAGSLLEFALEDISFPVGRVQFLNMHPLTFAEFVLAGGNQALFDVLVAPPTSLDEFTHGLLMDQLRQYFFVGGMPEAVRAWLDTGALTPAFEVQSEIIDAYRQDFAKYAPRSDKNCMNQVLTSCAGKVGEQIKYSELAQGLSNPTIHKAFDLLCMAQVLHKIPAVKAPALPLESTVNNRKFKASLIDVGLMQRLSHLPVTVEIRHEDLLAIHRGKLAEQFVAQELLAAQNRELHYWAREEKSSNSEVDYLLQKDGQIYPVEVKSGKGGTLRSLHLMLETYPQCPEGLVLYSGPYGKRPQQRLRFLPLYFAGAVSS